MGNKESAEQLTAQFLLRYISQSEGSVTYGQIMLMMKRVLCKLRQEGKVRNRFTRIGTPTFELELLPDGEREIEEIDLEQRIEAARHSSLPPPTRPIQRAYQGKEPVKVQHKVPCPPKIP